MAREVQTQVCHLLCLAALADPNTILDIESRIALEQNIPSTPGRTMKRARITDAMEDDGRVDCDCGTTVTRHSLRYLYPTTEGYHSG